MTQITASFGRRQFLLATAAVAVAAPTGLATRPSAAATGNGQVTTMSRTIGGFEVDALLDASGPFFLDRQRAFPDATQIDWELARALDPAAFGPGQTWNLDFRCFVVRGPGDGLMLIDTGVGPEGSPASAWAPVPGQLPYQLLTAGIDPRDVDVVVLTHLHEDHFGWSVDLDGIPTFPNARYVVQQNEVEALADGDAAYNYIIAPLRATGQLDEIMGTTLLAGAGDASSGSMHAVLTPGHTPGHQSVVIDGREEQLIVTGDVLVHAVQLIDPNVRYRYEADQDVARQTRRVLLTEAGARHAILATAHLRQPFVDASAVVSIATPG